jgi:uncharacterized protein
MTQPIRALMPDYLRLFALFGIVVVNVQFMAFSLLSGFEDMIGETSADAVALVMVNGLAFLKTYGLFSFMFGVGLGVLMRSAERRGLAFGKLYRNRMIGLALLGVLHGCLFFPGDILFIYAVTGTILYRFRNWEVARLVRLGVWLLAVQAVVAGFIMPLPSEMPADVVASEQAALTQGGFGDAVLFRSIGFAIFMPMALLFQGVAALGWFCLGLAAVRSGMIDNAAHPLWRRSRRVCLLPGVGLSLASALLWQSGEVYWGAVLVILIAPVATLGYLGLIAAIARPPGPLMERVLAAGGSSLTIYLGQSIILSTIFAGYGLEFWGEVGRADAVAIAVGVTLLLIALVSFWRLRFPQGPFEWVLRKIIHAGQER